VVTGPPASGKTTVGRLLAGHFPRGVHLEADVFRRNIVSGRAEMTPDASPEALEQLLLRYRLGAVCADAYFEAGFTVVLEDVIAGKLLAEAIALVQSRPVQVVVLLPQPEVLATRNAERQADGYRFWSVEALYDLFVSETPRIGLWLDTSSQKPEETVRHILASERQRSPAG
jgi:predicted kinase